MENQELKKEPRQRKLIFVYGLSGSGKDTISNHLKENHGFVKLRIAHTIKHIICETMNLSFDEIEDQKRINPAIREKHHEVGDWLDKSKATDHRIEQLINGKAMDYQLVDFENSHVICDVRSYKEAKVFLDAGYTGLFLMRTSTEYRNKTHHTEQFMFENGQMDQLIAEYKDVPNQIIIVDNVDKEYLSEEKAGIFKSIRAITKGTKEELLQITDHIVNHYIKSNILL